MVKTAKVASVLKSGCSNRTATGFFKTAVAVFFSMKWLQLQFL
jgi:hypothetical protein